MYYGWYLLYSRSMHKEFAQAVVTDPLCYELWTLLYPHVALQANFQIWITRMAWSHPRYSMHSYQLISLVSRSLILPLLFLLSRTLPQENPDSGWFLIFLVASFGCLPAVSKGQDPTRRFAVIHVWISRSVSPFQRCQGSSRHGLFLAWCKWLNAIWCWRNDSGWMDSSDVCLMISWEDRYFACQMQSWVLTIWIRGQAACACCDLGNVLQNTNLAERSRGSFVAASSSNLSNCWRPRWSGLYVNSFCAIKCSVMYCKSGRVCCPFSTSLCTPVV